MEMISVARKMLMYLGERPETGIQGQWLFQKLRQESITYYRWRMGTFQPQSGYRWSPT
jgi:hypothetical protein